MAHFHAVSIIAFTPVCWLPPAANRRSECRFRARVHPRPVFQHVQDFTEIRTDCRPARLLASRVYSSFDGADGGAWGQRAEVVGAELAASACGPRGSLPGPRPCSARTGPGTSGRCWGRRRGRLPRSPSKSGSPCRPRSRTANRLEGCSAPSPPRTGMVRRTCKLFHHPTGCGHRTHQGGCCASPTCRSGFPQCRCPGPEGMPARAGFVLDVDRSTVAG
jgi:hypothetical protein